MDLNIIFAEDTYILVPIFNSIQNITPHYIAHYKKS
jgi:hypothetical protein